MRETKVKIHLKAPLLKWEQLAGELRLSMREGRLRPGAVLPSTRRLAATLGLSRNTVIAAYEELRAEGLLATRRGSATRVIGFRRPAAGLDWKAIARASQFPARPMAFRDPEGHVLYLNDSR